MRTSSEEMQNALLGLLTLVAFGEKFIRDNAASKYSQGQVCDSLGKRSDGSAAFVACVPHIYILQFSTWNDLIGNVTPHIYFQRKWEFF